MNIISIVTPVVLFLYLVVPTAVLGVVEYFLARVESPWPGRILPILSGLYSLLMALMVLLNLAAPASLSTVILAALAVLVLLNIPTAVFLVVYRTTRRRFAEQRSMDHRDLQDL